MMTGQRIRDLRKEKKIISNRISRCRSCFTTNYNRLGK